MRDDPHAALLDSIIDEAEALDTRMPRGRLAQVLEERAHELAPGTPGRAEWLVQAGERWELAGDVGRARTCFEQALEDGGPTWLDPRALLVPVLLDLDATAEADELLERLRRDVARHGPRGPVHEMVGEALETHGRLHDALRWFGAGLTYLEREGTEGEDLTCLNGRFRIRRELDLAMDDYDVLCEERRQEAMARYEDPHRYDVLDARGKPPALTVLHWPAEQLDRVLGRWPRARADYGADHEEHRALVERHLRRLAGHGAPVSVGDGDLDEYLAFAERHDHEPTEASTRAAYTTHLGLSGRTTAWPPGRNDRCWCGSGAKYKKCCGALPD